MSTNEVVSAQAQGQLVSTDFNRFEQFLESLGLPKENILATTAERQVVQTNFLSL
ncbi:hypothetical protein ACT691_14170 [Vibrio metschnikovii]